MSTHVDVAAFLDASGAQRLAMVDHLRTCAACRAAAVEHDPTILFALLDRAPIPSSLLDEVSTVAVRRAEGGPVSLADRWAVSGGGARRWTAAAAMALLALVCGYGVVRNPSVAPQEVAGQGASAPVTTLGARLASVEVEPARTVSSVVDFTVGETQVVMVYNGALKL